MKKNVDKYDSLLYAIFSVLTSPKPPPFRRESMWEYDYVVLDAGQLGREFERAQEKGKEGWELVSSQLVPEFVHNMGLLMVFKRRLKE